MLATTMLLTLFVLLLLGLCMLLLLNLCMLLLLILSVFLGSSIRMDTRLLGRVMTALLSETTVLLHRRVIFARCSSRCILRMPAIH